ncbi:MAG: VWA-like domain-containing protein [Terrisporobacter sp.]|uniref:vWA domain-containing protein n=1 Tax=Terrisporobacter sp. TaxID=1965305 RepID=UPI002FC6A5D2
METYFGKQTKDLYDKAIEIINNETILKSKNNEDEEFEIKIPHDFQKEFFSLIETVNLSLMEEKDNFYGYFLFQMSREIKFDISSPSAMNFKKAKYVIYFNPLIFLKLNMNQMEETIKHEILHVLSLHLIRGKELKNKYSTLAINMAMDIVVNQYLNYLPPYALTLEWINSKYPSLNLESYQTFEYYVEKIQIELDLQEVDDDGEELDSDENVQTDFSPENTHDIWEYSNDIDEKTLKEFTEKFIDNSYKGTIQVYLEGLISSLKKSKAELPWNLYLKKLMGTVEANKKKTITRRNRRQPNRLDLRGELRGHKAEIAVAIDISGSISDEEYKQAVKEVLNIVKNYNHEITIIECDKEIRRVYKAKSVKDIKERIATGGGTKFNPVFEYANSKKTNLLVYFTDGKGEDKLQAIPRGYKVLWVISGRGDKLSVKEPYGVVKKLSKAKVKDDILEISDIRSDGYSMNNQAPLL